MKTFPMFLKMEGRRVVIIGGGEQAAQKTRLVLKTEAEIVLVADMLDPELDDLVDSGRAHLRGCGDLKDLFDNAILCFVATGCKGADAAWHGVAKDAGVVVNVVDYPDLCDAMTPSIVDRDPVVVAIGTEGTAPVLGRQIKTQIEQMLEPRLGHLAAVAGRLRGAVADRVALKDRRDFWRWVFADLPRQTFARGHEARAIGLIKDAISKGSAPESSAAGKLSIVDVEDRAPDEMTLRTVKRLQEADVIYFDAEIDPGILELARRDAERVALRRASHYRSDPFEFPLNRVPDGANAVWLVCRDAEKQLHARGTANPEIDIELLQFTKGEAVHPLLN